MTAHNLTRRRALGPAAAALVGSKVAPGLTAGVQPGMERAGVAPRTELVNTLEYEQQAKLKLAPAVFSLIAGGDRAGFDRITLRPRMLVDTRGISASRCLASSTLRRSWSDRSRIRSGFMPTASWRQSGELRRPGRS